MYDKLFFIVKIEAGFDAASAAPISCAIHFRLPWSGISAHSSKFSPADGTYQLRVPQHWGLRDEKS